MFTMITGLPGSSKTSHLLLKLMNEKNRPIYYRGIRGLKLDWHELTDEEAANWHEHVPDGGIVVIDEAQQIFPLRASSKPVPAGLAALETHRHHGWDVYFISQSPMLLDSHARKLCNDQYHYERPLSGKMVVEYHSPTGFINPENGGSFKRCARKTTTLPKKTWGLYHSAEIHTHKLKVPRVFWVLPVLAVFTVFMFWRVFSGLDSREPETVDSSTGPASYAQSVASASAPFLPDDWASAMRPAVRGLPWSAPLYNERARDVQVVPVIAGCMAFRNDQSDCRCYTQQGTRIRDMPLPMCRRALSDGVFNHLERSESEPRKPSPSSGSPSEISF